MTFSVMLGRLDAIQSSINSVDGVDGSGIAGSGGNAAKLTSGVIGGTMGSGSSTESAAADATSQESSAIFASLLGGSLSTGGVLGGVLGGSAATTSTASTTNAGTAVTGSDIVAEAEKYLGVPYKLGGESSSGIDCSGLVQLTLKNLGISVPRGVVGQATVGTEVGSLAQAQPGDLVVLKGDSHVVISAGNGMVVHAPYPGRTVSLQKEWFSDADVATIRRVSSSAIGSVPTA